MSLDVEPPDPPELESDTDPGDYEDVDGSANATHRDDLEAFLAGGAWAEAFAEWTSACDLDASAWRIVVDLAMTARFDFFWDDFAGRVGYHAPGIPEDWKERDLHPDLDSWSTVSAINASLTELGRTVADHLEDEYVDWDADYEAPDDLPEF